MALSEKQKAKAFALFPHVVAGMAVMLDVPGDEFEQWVRGLGVFPFAGDGVQSAGVRQENPTNGGVKKQATNAASRPKKPAIKEKLVAAVVEHPDWSCTKIAEYIGEKKGSVSGVASKAGIKFPPPPKKESVIDKIRLSQAKNLKCTTRQIADEWGLRPTSVAWAAKQHGVSIHKLAPSKRLEAGRRAGTMGGKARASGKANAGQEGVGRAPVRHPAGTLFYLRDDEGQYLHQSGAGMVKAKTYAWRGTERQLLNCRRKIKLAKTLREVVAK